MHSQQRTNGTLSGNADTSIKVYCKADRPWHKNGRRKHRLAEFRRSGDVERDPENRLPSAFEWVLKPHGVSRAYDSLTVGMDNKFGILLDEAVKAEVSRITTELEDRGFVKREGTEYTYDLWETSEEETGPELIETETIDPDWIRQDCEENSPATKPTQYPQFRPSEVLTLIPEDSQLKWGAVDGTHGAGLRISPEPAGIRWHMKCPCKLNIPPLRPIDLYSALDEVAERGETEISIQFLLNTIKLMQD